jgi:hypothetical protein
MPRISCTQLWTGPRVRLSFKERRMKFREPTKLHRKSGVWGTHRPVEGMEPKRSFPSTLHLPPAPRLLKSEIWATHLNGVTFWRERHFGPPLIFRRRTLQNGQSRGWLDCGRTNSETSGGRSKEVKRSRHGRSSAARRARAPHRRIRRRQNGIVDKSSGSRPNGLSQLRLFG